MVTMRRMVAGAGYEYLRKTLVAGDGDRSLSTPFTRYYAETGTPPGRWMGSGIRGLGLEVGAAVTETHSALLIGHGRHLLRGDQLGRAYPVYRVALPRQPRDIRMGRLGLRAPPGCPG